MGDDYKNDVQVAAASKKKKENTTTKKKGKVSKYTSKNKDKYDKEKRQLMKEEKKKQKSEVKEPPAKRPRSEESDNDESMDEETLKQQIISQSKKRKQELMERKRGRNPDFDIELKLKQMLEEYRDLNREAQRSKRMSEDGKVDPKVQERMEKKMDDLVRRIRGNGFKFARKGDMSRVMQAALKHGTARHRRNLYEKEFQGRLVEMSQDKHAHHIVESLFTYVAQSSAELLDVRKKMFKEFEGNVMKILTTRFSAATIEHIYSRIANRREKFLLEREFYGASNIPILNENDEEEDGSRSIAEILRDQPGRRLVVAERLAKVVKKVIHKGLLDNHIVHQIIADAFEICGKGDVTDVVHDLVEANALPYILHTKNGCKVCMYTISYSSPAERKKLVKQLKGHMIDAAKDPYGVLVLCRMIDVIDDVETSGLILKELKEDLPGIAADQNACKVLLHLLSPYNRSYFKNPLDLELLIPTLRREVITTHEQRKKAEEKEKQRRAAAVGKAIEDNKKEEEEESESSDSDAMQVDDTEKMEDEEDSGEPQDKFMPLISKKPLHVKHRELVAKIAHDLLNMAIKTPAGLLSDFNGTNVIFETLRLGNLELLCGDSDELRSLRRKALNRLIDALTANNYVVLGQHVESRTTSKLIMREQPEEAPKSCTESDLLVPRLFRRFDGKLAKLIVAHPDRLAFLFSSLIKFGQKEVADKAIKELAPVEPEIKKLYEKEGQKNAVKKGLNLLLKVLGDKLEQGKK